MAPHWALVPLVILATMATVIASQALISGAFSLTVQAVQLDYLPRVKIRHTSSAHRGQVYVPLVNWALMVGCIGLVVAFRTSSSLAAAYGIAVTTTMAITTMLFYVRRRVPMELVACQGAGDLRPRSWSSTWRSSAPTCPRSPTAAGSRCWSRSASSSR